MKRQRFRKALILISFLFFPVVLNYMSPALILEGASEGIVSGSFILFGLLFAGSLFFGRAWCGWLCPGAGLQEACFAARDRRVRGGDWVKYLIWVPWLVLIVLFVVKSGGLRRIDFFYMTEKGISAIDPMNYVIYYSVLALVVVLALTVGKRSFCHHVCWMAPFMILGRKIRNLFHWPSLRLRADGDLCAKCGKCAGACPMSLNVQEMVAQRKMERAECILCGSCADACPNGTIAFTWMEKRKPAPAIGKDRTV